MTVHQKKTDHEIHRRADSVILDKHSKEAILIECSRILGMNISCKEIEKIVKYYLTRKIKRI